jgi:predicted amino acid dehydrogenase
MNFALIGHQDNWNKIIGFIEFFNSGKNRPDKDKISEIYSFIPPRKLFDIEVSSTTGKVAKGCYVETFISPDELVFGYWKINMEKVREAAKLVRAEGAGIAALGGFTSIVLEGKDDSLNQHSNTKFTTGNTLTAAFIVKSIEKACLRFGKKLNEQNILVIGATGDIGSGCVRYFASRVAKLLLCARQGPALYELAGKLGQEGLAVSASMNVNELLPEADVIIAIANSTIDQFDSRLCKEDVIICDAGYPKNLINRVDQPLTGRLFSGGMGYISGEYVCRPNIMDRMYEFPLKKIGHGCLLEAIVLSFCDQYVPFSTGKGNITPEKIELIYSMARAHGILEAPFFNEKKVWE